MAEMNIRDVKRDIVGTLVIFKGRPVFVRSAHEEANGDILLRYMDVNTSKLETEVFNFKELSPIRGRVGMINDTSGGVYYITRKPVRKFYFGLNWENSRIGKVCDGQSAYDYDDIKAFRSKGWMEALNNDYPSLSKALSIAKQFRLGCAFDKQFAVLWDGSIVYKLKGMVGVINGRYKTIRHINWLPGNEHLALMLENDYEKTVRTFQP